jgi:hypothetical protein
MSSRRSIPARASDLTAVVGWDNPLSTFLAQVECVQSDDDQRDPILLWIGSEFGEVAEAELVEAPRRPSRRR